MTAALLCDLQQLWAAVPPELAYFGLPAFALGVIVGRAEERAHSKGDHHGNAA